MSFTDNADGAGDTDNAMEALFAMFDASLPRQGPGNNAATRQAWSLLGTLPTTPTVLDIGCGSGMQTLELARLSRGQVIGIDYFVPYLQMLQQRATHARLAAQVTPVNCSMDALAFADGSFDIIWSEGAMYIIGFAQGLAVCRPLLKPGGYFVASDLTKFVEQPADAVVQFWQEEQVVLPTVEQRLQEIEAAGYHCIGHFPLPQAAWWATFYTPLERRLTLLRQRYQHDPARLAVVEQQQREMDLYRCYSDQYGYTFYVSQLV